MFVLDAQINRPTRPQHKMSGKFAPACGLADGKPPSHVVTCRFCGGARAGKAGVTGHLQRSSDQRNLRSKGKPKLDHLVARRHFSFTLVELAASP